MSRIQILCLGVDLPPVEGLTHIDILSKQSLLDADIIVIRPTFSALEASGSFQGLPLLNDDDSFRVKNAQKEWWPRVSNALNAERTVVYMLPPLERVAVDTGERTYSGTGRNRHTTQVVAEFDNYRFLPFDRTTHKLVFESGANVVRTKDVGPLAGMHKAYEGRWRYHCLFEPSAMRAALTTKVGGHCVGALSRTGVVVIPDIDFSDEPLWKWVNAYSRQPTPEGNQAAYSLRDQLIALHKAVHADSAATPAPVWAAAPDLRLPTEAELESKLVHVEEEMARLQAQRAEVQAQLTEAGDLRNLLFGTGKSLERAVQKSLELLGFSVSSFDDGKSEFDVLFESEEGRFIGEVEGKDGKAVDVSKISQLRRNVDEDFAREEVQSPARGVLFGNGHRLIEPAARGDHFTSKVVDAAPALGITLVQTPDLFHAVKYYLATADTEFALQCRRAIADSIGEVVSFPNLESAPVESVAIACEDHDQIAQGGKKKGRS